MTKNRKKIISKVIASGMLLSNVPVQSFAQEIKKINIEEELHSDIINQYNSNYKNYSDNSMSYDNNIETCAIEDGSELYPFLINTIEDLNELSKQVNEGTLDTTNLHYKLTSDLDFSTFDIDNDGNVDSFTPIGNNWGKEFKGYFDGNNYTISNIKIESTYNSTGIFGVVQNVSIKNLKIENITILNGTNIGALVGYCNEDLTIDNVSVNNLKIESSQTYYGAGLVGYAGGKEITKISNVSININNAIKATTGYVGGLISSCESNVEIYNVDIKGDFTGSSGAGGLIAYMPDYSSAITRIIKISNINIESNINISRGYSNIGGVVGYIYTSSTKEDNCISLENINYSGSINKDIEESMDWAGGLIGYLYTQAQTPVSLKNNNIKLESIRGNYVGGLVGYASASIIAKDNIVSVDKTILSAIYVGGALGCHSTEKTLEMEKFEFVGKILVKQGTYAGGISGQSGIMNLKNINVCSEIRGDFTGVQAGGLVGWLGGNTLDVSGATLKLDIITPSSIATGGFVGYSSGSNITISKSSYTGNLEGKDSVAGILGYMRANKTNIEIGEVYLIGDIKGPKNVGGIVGYAYSPDESTIFNLKNSYIALSFDDSALSQKYLVSDMDSKIVIVNSYYDSSKTILTNDNLISLTTSQMQGKEAKENMKLDYNNIWKLNKEYYPTFEQINTAPTIITKDNVIDSTITINQYDEFKLLDYIIVEDFEGDEVTLSIKSAKENFNTSKYGIFPIVIVATDSNGLSSELELSLKIKPLQIAINNAPVIIAEDITLTVGDTFNPLDVIVAFDKEDGVLTPLTKVTENKVNINVAGKYTVTYEVEDKDGAKTTKTISVTVKDKITSDIDTDKDSNKPSKPENNNDNVSNTNNSEKPQTRDIGLIGILGAVLSIVGIIFINRRKK